MKYLASLYFLFFSLNGFSQADTAYIKAIYDRCLDFNEEKADSLHYYAVFIEQSSLKIGFAKGDVLSLRLKGLAEELKDDYSKAAEYYLLSLEAARKLNEPQYEASALSDLAILYANIDKPLLAKQYYLQATELSLKIGELHTVLTSFNNLGVIFSQLNEYDSALHYLGLAMQLYDQYAPELDRSNTINNIGSCFFKKGEYEKALSYFLQNYKKHEAGNLDQASIWVDHLNLADTYTELKRFDSAQFHADTALRIARSLGSKSKEADSYSILAKLYAGKGNYEKAYSLLKQWYTIDTSLTNGATQETIASLQERFNARKRETDNKLLLAEIEKEKFRGQAIMAVAAGLAIVGLLIAIAFIIKRNANRKLKIQNELIRRQNERLAELNHEKNALISIVSHDLGTPFATIQMWGEILKSDETKLDPEQQKAIQRILQAGANGEQLIRRILDVERDLIGNYSLQLESFDWSVTLKEQLESFRAAALQKNIVLTADLPQKGLPLLSDVHLVQRITENLISNAIKYTPPGKSVRVKLGEEGEWARLDVVDEGVGIPEDEMAQLFTKYSKISSKPTAGESSTGLGLSIVKRILDEINGRISCSSREGEGSVFTVWLKK